MDCLRSLCAVKTKFIVYRDRHRYPGWFQVLLCVCALGAGFVVYRNPSLSTGNEATNPARVHAISFIRSIPPSNDPTRQVQYKKENIQREQLVTNTSETSQINTVHSSKSDNTASENKESENIQSETPLSSIVKNNSDENKTNSEVAKKILGKYHSRFKEGTLNLNENKEKNQKVVKRNNHYSNLKYHSSFKIIDDSKKSNDEVNNFSNDQNPMTFDSITNSSENNVATRSKYFGERVRQYAKIEESQNGPFTTTTYIIDHSKQKHKPTGDQESKKGTESDAQNIPDSSGPSGGAEYVVDDSQRYTNYPQVPFAFPSEFSQDMNIPKESYDQYEEITSPGYMNDNANNVNHQSSGEYSAAIESTSPADFNSKKDDDVENSYFTADNAKNDKEPELANLDDIISTIQGVTQENMKDSFNADFGMDHSEKDQGVQYFNPENQKSENIETVSGNDNLEQYFVEKSPLQYQESVEPKNLEITKGEPHVEYILQQYTEDKTIQPTVDDVHNVNITKKSTTASKSNEQILKTGNFDLSQENVEQKELTKRQENVQNIVYNGELFSVSEGNKNQQPKHNLQINDDFILKHFNEQFENTEVKNTSQTEHFNHNYGGNKNKNIARRRPANNLKTKNVRLNNAHHAKINSKYAKHNPQIEEEYFVVHENKPAQHEYDPRFKIFQKEQNNFHNVAQDPKNVVHQHQNIFHEAKNAGHSNENIFHEAKNEGYSNQNNFQEPKNAGQLQQNIFHEAKNIVQEYENIFPESKNAGHSTQNIYHEPKNVVQDYQAHFHESKNEGPSNENIFHEPKNVVQEYQNVNLKPKNRGNSRQNIFHEPKNVIHLKQNIFHEPKNAVHSNQNIFHETKNAIHSNQNIFHEPKNVVQDYQANFHESKNAGHSNENIFHEPKNVVQEYQNMNFKPKNRGHPNHNIFHETKNAVHSNQNIFHEPKNVVQEYQANFHESKNAGHSNKNNFHKPQIVVQEYENINFKPKNRGHSNQNNFQEPQNIAQEYQSFNHEPKNIEFEEHIIMQEPKKVLHNNLSTRNSNSSKSLRNKYGNNKNRGNNKKNKVKHNLNNHEAEIQNIEPNPLLTTGKENVEQIQYVYVPQENANTKNNYFNVHEIENNREVGPSEHEVHNIHLSHEINDNSEYQNAQNQKEHFNIQPTLENNNETSYQIVEDVHNIHVAGLDQPNNNSSHHEIIISNTNKDNGKYYPVFKKGKSPTPYISFHSKLRNGDIPQTHEAPVSEEDIKKIHENVNEHYPFAHENNNKQEINIHVPQINTQLPHNNTKNKNRKANSELGNKYLRFRNNFRKNNFERQKKKNNQLYNDFQVQITENHDPSSENPKSSEIISPEFKIQETPVTSIKNVNSGPRFIKGLKKEGRKSEITIQAHVLNGNYHKNAKGKDTASEIHIDLNHPKQSESFELGNVKDIKPEVTFVDTSQLPNDANDDDIGVNVSDNGAFYTQDSQGNLHLNKHVEGSNEEVVTIDNPFIKPQKSNLFKNNFHHLEDLTGNNDVTITLNDKPVPEVSVIKNSNDRKRTNSTISSTIRNSIWNRLRGKKTKKYNTKNNDKNKHFENNFYNDLKIPRPIITGHKFIIRKKPESYVIPITPGSVELPEPDIKFNLPTVPENKINTFLNTHKIPQTDFPIFDQYFDELQSMKDIADVMKNGYNDEHDGMYYEIPEVDGNAKPIFPKYSFPLNPKVEPVEPIRSLDFSTFDFYDQMPKMQDEYSTTFEDFVNKHYKPFENRKISFEVTDFDNIPQFSNQENFQHVEIANVTLYTVTNDTKKNVTLNNVKHVVLGSKSYAPIDNEQQEIPCLQCENDELKHERVDKNIYNNKNLSRKQNIDRVNADVQGSESQTVENIENLNKTENTTQTT